MKKSNKLSNDDLKNLAEEAIASSEDYLADYFWLSDKFPNYSSNNVQLIIGQSKGKATLVKSFSEWKKDNVSVNKGEKAMRIFIPQKYKIVCDENGYNIGFRSQLNDEQLDKLKKGVYSTKEHTSFVFKAVLFDIKQTNADIDSYLKTVVIENELQNVLKDVAKNSDIKVEYSNLMDDNHLGFATIHDEKIIRLNNKLTDLHNNRTLIHEIAHHTLGHFENVDKINEAQMEFEAEAVAYLVSKNYGVEDSAFSNKYLKYHFTNGNFELEAVQEKVLNIANTLISEIDSYEVVSGLENNMEVE